MTMIRFDETSDDETMDWEVQGYAVRPLAITEPLSPEALARTNFNTVKDYASDIYARANEARQAGVATPRGRVVAEMWAPANIAIANFIGSLTGAARTQAMADLERSGVKVPGLTGVGA